MTSREAGTPLTAGTGVTISAEVWCYGEDSWLELWLSQSPLDVRAALGAGNGSSWDLSQLSMLRIVSCRDTYTLPSVSRARMT